MKNILPAFLAVSLFIFITDCAMTPRSDNPLIGKWQSLWDNKNNRITIDFNVRFENNNTFHTEASGIGQTAPEKVDGNYKIHQDTFVVCDQFAEPKQVCNFSDTGTYTFKQSNDTMFFKVIKDDCQKRKITLEIGLVKAKQD